MRRLIAQSAALVALAGPMAQAAVNVVIVEGLGGEEKYRAEFTEQVNALRDAARSVTADDRIKVFDSASAARTAITQYFQALAEQLDSSDQLIVYLIGHGSYDEHEYKFNLSGPDLTDTDIATALGGIPAGHQVLVNTSSASGAAVEDWRGDGRIVITATRSGGERHATKFGRYFVAALADPAADVNKNEIISAQEAFDYGARQVADLFDESSRLATEHPRLEGDRADRFALARLTQARSDSADPELTSLYRERDARAANVDELRLARDSLTPEQYQEQLLEQMLELATIEEAIETREKEIVGEQ